MWRREDTVLKERRQSRRYPVNGFVQIQSGAGTSPRECRLTNISDGGVRLYADAFDIAEEFTLWLPEAVGGRRQCRVVWRLGHEVGAEFIDRPREHLAHDVLRSGFGARGG